MIKQSQVLEYLKILNRHKNIKQNCIARQNKNSQCQKKRIFFKTNHNFSMDDLRVEGRNNSMVHRSSPFTKTLPVKKSLFDLSSIHSAHFKHSEKSPCLKQSIHFLGQKNGIARVFDTVVMTNNFMDNMPDMLMKQRFEKRESMEEGDYLKPRKEHNLSDNVANEDLSQQRSQLLNQLNCLKKRRRIIVSKISGNQGKENEGVSIFKSL